MHFKIPLGKEKSIEVKTFKAVKACVIKTAGTLRDVGGNTKLLGDRQIITRTQLTGHKELLKDIGIPDLGDIGDHTIIEYSKKGGGVIGITKNGRIVDPLGYNKWGGEETTTINGVVIRITTAKT